MDPDFHSRYFGERDEAARPAAPVSEPGVGPEPTVGGPPTVPESGELPAWVGPGEPAPGQGQHRAQAPAEAPALPAPVVVHNGAHGGPPAPHWDSAPPAGQWRPASGPTTTPGHSPAGSAPAWASAARPSAHLRRDELVKARRLPPEMGWRKGVYVGSAHAINLGAGPAERTLRDQIARIGTNIPGNYQIAVVSTKGGVGKTRVSAGTGTAFAMYRTEPVITVDANPTYGSLGELVDPSAGASIREFMADERVETYPRARHYTGKNAQGLEVLSGNQNVANPLPLSAELFSSVLARTRRFYQLSLIDCGNEIEHPVMAGVFNEADALVIVGATNYDGAKAAEKTLNWLEARNGHELLQRSVLVLNDVYDCADKRFVTAVTNSLGARVGAVKRIPWDAHLRDTAVLDFGALQRGTQLAFIDLAATLADGFNAAVTPAGR